MTRHPTADECARFVIAHVYRASHGAPEYVWTWWLRLTPAATRRLVNAVRSARAARAGA